MQSSDYDDTRLLTGENLCRQRAKSLAHLSLKHISLLGVVRIKLKQKKKNKKKTAVNTRVSVPRPNHYLFDEAVAAAENYDSEDEELLDEAEEEAADYDFADGYNDEGELIERGLSKRKEMNGVCILTLHYKIFIKHSKDMFVSNMSRIANIQRHDHSIRV